MTFSSSIAHEFPVPACPKRTRPRSGTGLFTQLIIKSRDTTRVPIRQPLSGLNRELTLRGISLIIASSSMTTIGSVTQKQTKTTYRSLQLGLTGPEAESTTSPRIWNAVICVEMVARSKKAVWRLVRTSVNSLTFFSGPPSIFFNVRFPGNSMFTNADETDEDDVQNCGSFAYDWIKSQQLPTSSSI
jgi:hypothetical protein